ncbi:MAG: Maf family protein [Bacillota bacterium]
MNLVLASASPRRAELLRQVGISFTITRPDLEEKPDLQKEPQEIAMALAEDKARFVGQKLDRGIVLAADTLVVYQGQLMGKPEDRKDARRMLRILSGSRHEVITGLVLLDAASGLILKDFSTTTVWIKVLSDQEIDNYVKGGEPLDKAGAYGIQGKAALFVDRIEGCYFNVVGLPLGLLYEMIQKMQFTMQQHKKG